jgi:hypothetical protein
LVGLVWLGLAWLCQALLGLANVWLGVARLGLDLLWFCAFSLHLCTKRSWNPSWSLAWLSLAWLGLPWLGLLSFLVYCVTNSIGAQVVHWLGCGLACVGWAWLGKLSLAWPDLAWLCQARLGLAWRDLAVCLRLSLQL